MSFPMNFAQLHHPSVLAEVGLVEGIASDLRAAPLAALGVRLGGLATAGTRVLSPSPF